MVAATQPKSIVSEYPPHALDLQKANQVPKMCAKLAGILDRTPLFQGTQCAVLALTHWDDASICTIMSDNAANVLGKNRAWSIHNFGRNNHQLFEPNGTLIQQGISLLETGKRCSLADLEDAYTSVFQSMTTGWVAANIAEHPNILFKADPEKWALFIKNKPLVEESTLVSSIASRLSLSPDLQCYDIWIDAPGSTKPDKPYLWIRKRALSHVVEKLGLQFVSKL